MAKRKKDKLRVAFIGAGGIAGAHMRYYKEMEDVRDGGSIGCDGGECAKSL